MTVKTFGSTNHREEKNKKKEHWHQSLEVLNELIFTLATCKASGTREEQMCGIPAKQTYIADDRVER